MKKIFLTIALFTAALFTTCDDSTKIPGNGFENIESLPGGVYIAGSYSNGSIQYACYWTGNKRVTLNGSYADSIMVSDGIVLITGYYKNGPENSNTKRCYWMNGTRFDAVSDSSDIIISKEKICELDYRGNVFIDRVELELNSLQYWSGFIASAITAANGRLHIIGRLSGGSQVLYCTDNASKWTIFNNDTSGFSFVPEAVTVTSDGTVCVAGHSGSYSSDKKYWYGINGAFTELQGFPTLDDIKRVTISDNKVYVFKSYYGDGIFEYWQDGKKVTINLPESTSFDENVRDIAIFGGKLWMVGEYINFWPTNACYWVDGVRCDLYTRENESASAFAIFVVK